MRLRLRLVSALAVLSVASACATTGQPVEASMTISEEPNTPGATAAEAPVPAVTLQKLAPPEGFAVMMPGEPKEQRGTKPSKAGDIVTAAWNSNVDNVVYSISVVDYPAKLVGNKKPEGFIEEAKTSIVTQLKGTLKEEQEATLDGHPGKAFVVASDAGEVKARNYFVGNRLYTLLVVYNPAIGAAAGEQFLTSLELVPAQPAAAAQP
ncbi:MAG: hypothetical protein L0Y66_08825 [Myxococcaceae bacterium]|nr:hypothetical protein [Myxococcaceae bacterium]